ncbi:MAG TPA: DUF4129 domain-containing protein [Puia sp.]|nr:DUF4129 domain-containing protein [Puia sp.]
MTGRYRAGIVGVLLGLLACIPAGSTAQDSSAAADSAGVVTDSAGAAADKAEPVVLRAIDDSVVAGWKSDKVYEYANDSAYWWWDPAQAQQRVSGRPYSGHGAPADEPSDGPLMRLFSSKGFEYFFLFTLGAILVYAIVRIIVTNRLQLFYRPPARPMAVKAGEEGGSPEDDLEGRLQHFMQIRDYRQAVRYLYLKTLRLLNDRGMIRYHQESTNLEYWQQLRATPQGGPFRDLTMIYERVWYGEFPLGDALFMRLHQYFEDFYKSVRA